MEGGGAAGDGDCVLRQMRLQPPTTAEAVADEEVVEAGGGARGRLAGGGEAAMEVARVLAPLRSAAVTGAGRASLSMPCADSYRYSHEDGGLSRQKRAGDDVQENSSSSSSSSSSRARGVKRTRLQAEEPAAVDSDLTMVIPPHRSEKCETPLPHTQPGRCSFLESWGVSPPRSPVPTRRPACAPALGGEGGEEERHLSILEKDAPALGAPTSRARSIQPVHGDSCQGGGGSEPVACVSPTCRSGGVEGGGEQAPAPAWLLALGWSPLKNSTRDGLCAAGPLCVDLGGGPFRSTLRNDPFPRIPFNFDQCRPYTPQPNRLVFCAMCPINSVASRVQKPLPSRALASASGARQVYWRSGRRQHWAPGAPRNGAKAVSGPYGQIPGRVGCKP